MNSDNLKNTKLLSLIEDWLIANNTKDSYKNVILELLNGDSFLFIEIHDNKETIKNETIITEEKHTIKLGIYETNGQKFLNAFTDLELLSNWLKRKSQYVKLESKTLLNMADDLKVDGIVINSSYRNMFVAFRN